MKIVLALAVTLVVTAASAGTGDKPTTTPPPIDPATPIRVTLPVQDWQAVLASVADSGRISARDASRINQAIVSQVQAQFVASAATKQ